MSTIGKACCAQCRFWQPPVSGDVDMLPITMRAATDLSYWQNACKRRAPAIASNEQYTGSGTAEWPKTTGNQWCGEFEQYAESVGAL